ncbi:MAG: hypothetical protein ABR520_11245 [Mycobacteriales bacterium]|nr:hypothetical protein [Actinomycetota bacterium]
MTNGAQTQGTGDEVASLLAELEAEGKTKPADPAPAKPAAKSAKPAPSVEPAGDAADDADPDDERADDRGKDRDRDEDDEDEVDADADDPDDEDADPDDDEDRDGDQDDEPDEDADADPETKKRMAAVRRTDRRLRERRDAERAQLDRDRAAFQTETRQLRGEVDQFKKLIARAKIDPVALLEAAGLGPDDMEYAATQAFARSAKASGKPEYRTAAERAIRERESADKATASEKRIADLEAKLEAKERQAAEDAELEAYFKRALRKATDATPITKKLIDTRPKLARRELTATAGELAQKLGRLPKVAELLVEHERKEARALRARGIAVPGAAAPAAETEAAAKDTKAAPVKPAKGAKPAAAAKPATKPAAKPEAEVGAGLPSTDDLLREMRAGAHLI